MKRYHRAAEGMTGGIKASGNYAPCFKASQEVKAAGFNEVLFLDSKFDEADEEVLSYWHGTEARTISRLLVFSLGSQVR